MSLIGLICVAIVVLLVVGALLGRLPWQTAIIGLVVVLLCYLLVSAVVSGGLHL
jgi:hypothetical protein